MSDPIDRAIAAADQPEPLHMIEVPIMIASTGRPAVLGVPADISDLEVMEVAAWMLRSLRPHIANAARPGAGLVVARGMPT